MDEKDLLGGTRGCRAYSLDRVEARRRGAVDSIGRNRMEETTEEEEAIEGGRVGDNIILTRFDETEA